MKSLSEIKNLLQQHKESLFDKYPLSAMAIFGSYARNEATETSDIDILVDFRQPVGMELVDLALELEKYLGITVDIFYPKPNSRLLPYIQNELIYV